MTDIKRVRRIGIIGFLLLVSCKEKRSVISEVSSEEVRTETYVCPSECENGMTYYLEGKCDICHHNLIHEK